jgi:enoyl-CoA hydratase/carnithine racemase
MLIQPEAPMSTPVLSMSRNQAVAVITLSSPPVNALSRALIKALHAAMDAVEADKSIGAVHIRSESKAFCAGADLAEMKENLADPDKVDTQIDFVRDLQNVLKRIETLPVATIAEVGGAAMGGGLELALACDFRVAAHEAKLALPEVNLGLIPGAGGTQRMTRLCGPSLAKRLILGAEILDGQTAERLGVVHWSVPRAELAQFAAQLAERISKLPRAAIAVSKSCIEAAGDPDRDGYEEELTGTRELLLHEPETRRRVEAFLSGQR